jgi:hypothetical protein
MIFHVAQELLCASPNFSQIPFFEALMNEITHSGRSSAREAVPFQPAVFPI